MKRSMPTEVAKSLASVMAYFDWGKVVDYEKMEGRLKDLDREESLDIVKEDALNEMLDMFDTVETEYQWRESGHCLRYEYFKNSGFKLFYCPVTADYVGEEDGNN